MIILTKSHDRYLMKFHYQVKEHFHKDIGVLNYIGL